MVIAPKTGFNLGSSGFRSVLVFKNALHKRFEKLGVIAYPQFVYQMFIYAVKIKLDNIFPRYNFNKYPEPGVV